MKTIVLIDDEPLVCETVKISLGARGYRVVAVEDPREGLATVRSEKPDLVILDLYMPEVDGLSLLRAMKADPSLKGTPVLVFSGSSQTLDVISGFDAGAYDYVAKPVDGDVLVAKVRSILKDEPLKA